jgi:hypothetical protein
MVQELNEITACVREGRLLSPILLNIYLDDATHKWQTNLDDDFIKDMRMNCLLLLTTL